MATTENLLATSLKALKKIQQNNSFMIIKNSDLSKTNLKRLIDNNFLRLIIKGWYIIIDPTTLDGDSTAWYASFWNFIKMYATERYGNNWCLSAEQSLSIHSGDTIIPNQILIKSPKGNNSIINLISPTSLLNLKSKLPLRIENNNKYNINIYPLEEALINVSPAMYKNDALTMRTSLSMIKNSSNILKILADAGHTTKAGRLAGAFRNIGQTNIANEIIETMKSFGYDIREEDPFTEIIKVEPSKSPYIARLKLMWKNMRDDVINNFNRKKSNLNTKEFLSKIEAQYKLDSYHSLSIEGYKVSDELIKKVQNGDWKPETNDANLKNALSARGYWQAFQAVKTSISDILNNKNYADIIKRDLSIWHKEMFMPCVQANIIKASDIIGYRSNNVYIRNSMHTPLNPDYILDAMETLFELIKNEENPAVRAVLGHFMFTFIHPYIDGNGRIGRFLMNSMFASGNYDWLIIPVEKRDEYMNSLEIASVKRDIIPFANFLSSL